MVENRYKIVGRRFLANVIDEIIFVPVSILSSNISSSGFISIVLLFVPILFWTFYFVFFNGKYGQTIGKKLIGIKILDINEKEVIGFKRALYRDGFWFIAGLIGLGYFIFSFTGNRESVEGVRNNYDEYMSTISVIWMLIEIATVFTNQKRRALHDYLASSVVIAV